MNSNTMNYEDYLNLYYFVKHKTKEIFKDYNKNFHPTLQDIEEYNKKVEQFKKAWEKDKSLVHKAILISEPPKEVDEDNNFVGCQEIGHKWELYIEKEFKKCGVELGMYYDNRQYKGENEFGIEIKHDSKIQAYKKKNIFIEYDAINKEGTEFINGGITKEDNATYWLIGNEDFGYFIFYKKDLYKIYRQVVLEHQKIEGCEIKATKKGDKILSHGIAISVEKARELMIADNIKEFLIKIGKIEEE